MCVGVCACACVWPNKSLARDIFTAGKWRVNLWCLFRGLKRFAWPRAGDTHTRARTHFFTHSLFFPLTFPAFVGSIFMKPFELSHTELKPHSPYQRAAPLESGLDGDSWRAAKVTEATSTLWNIRLDRGGENAGLKRRRDVWINRKSTARCVTGRQMALERQKQGDDRKEDRGPFPGGCFTSNTIPPKLVEEMKCPRTHPSPSRPIRLIPCKMLAFRPQRERDDNGGFIRLE